MAGFGIDGIISGLDTTSLINALISAEAGPQRILANKRTAAESLITAWQSLNTKIAALTDRAKDVIKSGGEWISSVELENALMAHPAVLEACVVGVPDERWGERPLATVVLQEGASVTPAQLHEFLAGTLARWQLPERWAFIEAVPKTSVGKFDKKVVRQRYAEGDLRAEQLT